MTDRSGEDAGVGGLVARARDGDADAFRALVQRFHGRMHRWAYGLTADADEADDVVQSALLSVYRSLRGYRGESAFTTWLYRIVRNAAAAQRRRAARRAAMAEQRGPAAALGVAAEAGASAAALDRARLAALVLEYYRDLPARQRVVFDLADLQGYASTEIAELMDLEPVTVRTHLLRARRAIRARILERHPELVEEYRS